MPHFRSQTYETVELVLGHAGVQLYPHLTCVVRRVCTGGSGVSSVSAAVVLGLSGPAAEGVVDRVPAVLVCGALGW